MGTWNRSLKKVYVWKPELLEGYNLPFDVFARLRVSGITDIAC